MASTNENQKADDEEEEEYLDITDLIRQCASECLSYSHPFTPLAAKVNNINGEEATTAGSNDDCDYDDAAVTDGTLLDGLHVQGTSIIDDDNKPSKKLLISKANDNDNDTHHNDGRSLIPPKLTPLDLQDAMTALELGDKRMDCCEIPPLVHNNMNIDQDNNNDSSSSSSPQNKEQQPLDNMSQVVTFPPRIAPTSLSDGTPLPITPKNGTSSQSSCTLSENPPDNNDNKNNNNILLLPSTPCPSLLPHWNNLTLLQSSKKSSPPSTILPLLMLQLTTLEAYIGTNNGGSNAAETLYCMMWCHDGVLMDMSERLSSSSGRTSSSSSLGGDGTTTKVDADVCMNVMDGAAGDATANNNASDTTTSPKVHLDNGSVVDERTVAQWVLFASSLGVVRIAEVVRWVVVNADFYEEEDFGVALHGGKAVDQNHKQGDDNKEKKKANGEEEGGEKELMNEMNNNADSTSSTSSSSEGQPTTTAKKQKQEGKGKQKSSSMRFCPALKGSQYIEIVWDTALSYLRLYRTHCMAQGTIDNDTLLNPTIDALETILQLQQSFFQTVKILSNLNDETVCNFTKMAVGRSRETVALLEKLCDNDVVVELSKGGLVDLDGRLLLPPQTTTLHHDDNEPQLSLNQLLTASFDPFVNRRLLGNAPVRKACFRPPLDVLSSLSELASELEWGVCDPILYGNSFGRITRMLERNSLRGCGGVVPMAVAAGATKEEKEKKKKESSPSAASSGTPVGMNILSRSLVVLNLYFDDKLFGQYDFSDMVGQHMRQQSAAPELLLESTCPDGSLAWVSRLAKPMYDTLKALCLNRHRERGFTETILLPAFQLLQYEAATVDEKFRKEHGLDSSTTPAYATNYVILNTIRLMERHVGLGVELGLYPNWYDLSTALWYRDFLLSALINVKGSIERERTQRREMDLRIKMEQEEERKAKDQQQQQQSKKKGKTKKGKKQKQITSLPTPDSTPVLPVEVSVKPTEEDFEDRLDYTSLLLHRNLCRGLVRYIAALCQAKLLRDPPASITMFTTHQKRFEKRFEAFSTLPQPPSLSYEDYMRGSDFSAVQKKDLLASATDCFRSGKGVVDWLLDVVVLENCDESNINGTEKRKDDDLYISIRREEIMALAKVCVTNSLFLHKLASATANAGSKNSKVSLEFKAHKQYCTLSYT